VRQGEECFAGEEADADEEPGLMTVAWRADVTTLTANISGNGQDIENWKQTSSTVIRGEFDKNW